MKKKNLYELIYAVKAMNDSYYSKSTYMIGDSVQYIVNKFEEFKQENVNLLEVKEIGICWYETN